MLVIKDFATTTLASALTAVATSIVVSDASRLPALSAGDYFYLVLQKFVDRNYVEIVKVTGVSSNTLTVERAQAGTTGKAFAIGDYAEVRLTVGVFEGYVAQLTASKVDKESAAVSQSLDLLNVGDLVSARLRIAYESARHVVALGGATGVNKANPYIALRPLGVSDASTQVVYDADGNFTFVGGERALNNLGKLSSFVGADALGWPTSVNNDPNNYINRSRHRFVVNNNGLHFLADGATNARRFGIQSAHADGLYATSVGVLDLNPYGGLVRVNGGTVYHTGYMPTPSALGVLALSGGIMTGNIQSGATYRTSINQSLGFVMQRPGAAQPVGLGQGGEGHAVVGYGPENALLAYLKVGTNALFADLGNGIKNLYHEDYLPTPAIIGAVPTSRTVNGKPLSSDVVLTHADVSALSLAGGTLTSTLIIAPTVAGLNGVNLYGTPSSGPNARGVFGFNADGSVRNWGTGVYSTNPTTLLYAFLGLGGAPWNTGLKVYETEVRFGDSRLYHESYLPTPAVLGVMPYDAATQTAPISAFFDSGTSATQMGVRVTGKDIYFFGDANRVGIYSRLAGLVDGAMIAARYADDGRVEFGVNNKMTRLYGNSILLSGGNVQLENTALGTERALVIERGVKRARITVGQPVAGVYAALLGTLNQAGNGYYYVGVSEDGKPLYHDGTAAYKLATSNYNAEQAGGQEYYTLAAPAGAVGGMFYPVLVPVSALGSEIVITTAGGSAVVPMNSCTFKGYVRAAGWSDRISVLDGLFSQYDAAERSIASAHIPTESSGGVVFYVEGRAFPVTILRTSAENLAPPTTHQTSVTHGTAVFPAVATPAYSTGTKAVRLCDFIFGSGPYRTTGFNFLFSGSVAANTGFTLWVTAGVYAILGASTTDANQRVTATLVYDGQSSTAYYGSAVGNHPGFQIRYNGATGKWDSPASTGYVIQAIYKVA